jgi:hypothetical protein
LKSREPEMYDRLVAEWNEWNAAMLPEIADSFTDNFTGGQPADHIGTKRVSGARPTRRSWRQPLGHLIEYLNG